MLTLVITFTVIGLLLAILAIPLLLRRVPPNAWYGVRVAATFADPWVWYEANALSGRDLLIAGIAQSLTALLLPLLGVSSRDLYVAINAAVLLVGSMTFAVIGIRRANRLWRQRGGAA
jgi:uncharacterized membrane protein